jgi:predicted PurR-regulated permease PerM
LSDRTYKRIVLLVIGAIFLCWGIFNYHLLIKLIKLIYGLVFPFILGGAIAFILNLPMRSVEKVLMKLFTTKKSTPKLSRVRPFSIIITLIVVMGVISGIIGIIIPLTGETLISVRDEVPRFVISCQRFLQKLSLEMPDLATLLNELSIDWVTIVTKLSKFLSDLGTAALSSSVYLATGVFSGIVNFILAFIFSLYLLADKEKLSKTCTNILDIYVKEKIKNPLLKFLTISNKIFSDFISGQCIEAVILGVLVYIAMLIFGFPYAELISVLVAVTALIPIFGAFIAGALGAVLIMIQSPVKALWFILLFFIIQQLEGNLIYPRVVGGKLGIPPILVLVAVTLGGGCFGIAGVLIFIPLFGVAYTLFTEHTKVKTAANTVISSQVKQESSLSDQENQ